jgi:uncharacterized membrane protein
MSWRVWSWVIAVVLTLAGLGLVWWQIGTLSGALRWSWPLVVAGVLIGIASTWTLAIELAQRAASKDLADDKAAYEHLREMERDNQQKSWDTIADARNAIQAEAQALAQEKTQVQQILAQAEAEKIHAQHQVESAERRRQNATAAAARMRRKLKQH